MLQRKDPDFYGGCKDWWIDTERPAERPNLSREFEEGLPKEMIFKLALKGE